MLTSCLLISILIIVASDDRHATIDMEHIEELPFIPEYDDAAQRGPQWYDEDSRVSKSETEGGDSDEALSADESSSGSRATTVAVVTSSVETEERKIRNQTYRTCTACPDDMMKRYTNIGIKWICGAYQRARRTFKSECMMRYRNCQDGTMFVKVYDHRCSNDTFHGRHWFYVYKV